MSHFYGSIPVSARKTEATARAHKSTGLTVRAASWSGAIETTLSYDEKTGKDVYQVWQVPHQGQGIRVLLAVGIVGE